MKEGRIGCAEKPKQGGSLEVDHMGGPYSFSKKGWVRKGYELFKSGPGDLERGFLLGRPLESGGVISPPPQRSGLVQIK